MANPILAALGNKMPQGNIMPQQTNNPLQLIQQFNQFRQQLGNRNPKQMVEQLLSSGQMSQQQFEQLQQQAQSLQSILK